MGVIRVRKFQYLIVFNEISRVNLVSNYSYKKLWVLDGSHVPFEEMVGTKVRDVNLISHETDQKKIKYSLK